MVFEHPANGYRVECNNAILWSFLFGCFYLCYKGLWGWAVLAFLLAICTFSLSWFVFPFFVPRLLRAHYMQRGWTHISQFANVSA